jgi:CubicO group peptidase (beta-lactamase class C family)
MSYEKATQKTLLKPLNLDSTFFYPDDALLTQRVASGHTRKNGEIIVARPWAVGRVTNPVAGVISTVKDLLRYARFHMGDGKTSSGKQIISQAGLESMRIAQIEADGQRKMGLTWFIRKAGELTLYGHGGATLGQQAGLHFIPAKNFAIAILTNSDDGGIIAEHTLKLALEIYFDTIQPLPTPMLKTGPELEEYSGMYELPLSALRIEIGEGCLVLHEIPRGGFPTPQSPPGDAMPPVRLSFYDHDKVIGLDEPMKDSLAEFIRNPEGNLAYLRIGGRIHPKGS